MLVKASSTRTDALTSPRSTPQLASAKGHRYAVLCPCPIPTYLIGGQEWPCRDCQGPLSVVPRHQTQGPSLAPLLFEALGRLIGLLCRAPLWGSAQACSSCWVRRRRKEQRLIPLQVSLSVATLHFQWLGKVTSALDKPVQEPHKQHQFRKPPHNISGFCDRAQERILCLEITKILESFFIKAGILTQSSVLHTLTHRTLVQPQLNNQTHINTMLLTTSLVWIMD